MLYDREHEDREEIGRRLAEQRGLAVIPPYDHPTSSPAHGTAARELIDETGPLDMLLTPCGGGGLLSGTALAASACAGLPGDRRRTRWRATMRRVRFEHGRCRRYGTRRRSLTARARPRSAISRFRSCSRMSPTCSTVDDGPLLRAMFYLWERLKLVVEPTGALAAAAVLEGAVDVRGMRVGVVLSGGNVDLSQVQQWREMV